MLVDRGDLFLNLFHSRWEAQGFSEVPYQHLNLLIVFQSWLQSLTFLESLSIVQLVLRQQQMWELQRSPVEGQNDDQR